MTKEDNAIKNFGTYIGSPSEEQLKQFFYLSDSDKEIIHLMRLPSTKIGFAIQLVTVRFLGTFITDFSSIPKNVLSYVSNQLNVNPEDIKSYTRQPTRSEHVNIIKEKYGYKNFGSINTKECLYKWLLDRATYTTETSEMLFDMLLKKCLDEKILLPGITTFTRFIANIVEISENNLFDKLAKVPSIEENGELIDLLETTSNPIDGVYSKMDILRSNLIDESKKEIERGFVRLKEFQVFDINKWDLSFIPEGKVKNLADYAFKAKSRLIQRMNNNKKLALLTAFIYEYQKKATDELLLALSKYYESIFRRAKNKESKERLRTIKDLDQAALTLSEIVGFILDENIENNNIRREILNSYSKEDISFAMTQIKNLARNEQEPIAIAELIQSFRKFKQFIPNILDTLQLEGNIYGENCLIILDLIRKRFPKPITYKMFIEVESSLSKKWCYFIHNNPDKVNQSVIIAGIEILIKGLKKHDIFVKQSNKFKDPMSSLIDKETWKHQKIF